MVSRIRLDRLVVERRLADTREKAQALILAGQVRVNGQRADKAGARVAEDADLELVGLPPRYAGRGGLKLEGALEDFGLSPAGRVCLDIGASTGGFTDCLLQQGAARVFAVDVGKGQLDWKLRQDPRVVALEGINARYLRPEELGGPADWVVIDVAFISVTKILPAALGCAVPGAVFLILVKPQFELSREKVGKGGIVRDAGRQQEAVESVRQAVSRLGLEILGVRPSRITGAEGNLEFFLCARKPPLPSPTG